MSTLVHALSHLDLPAIDRLLDPSRTYQDAFKDVFMSKLGEVFDQFKARGDNHLTPWPGKCASCECENKGKKGYCFVGKSGAFLSLIIEVDGTGIIDLYQCRDFKSKADVAPFGSIPLKIAEDEKHDFVPSINYLIKSVKCEQAVTEILRAGPVLSAWNCINWIAKHRMLFNSFDLPPYYFRKYDDFYALYKQVSAITAFLESETQIGHANTCWRELDASSETMLLRHLTRFESLYAKLFWFHHSMRDQYEAIESTGYLTVCDKKRLLLPLKTVEPLRIFISQFQTPYSRMMAKYRIPADDPDSPRRTLAGLLQYHGVEL